MTVDQLLTAAEDWLEAATAAADPDEFYQCAKLVEVNALLAQAKIMQQMTDPGTRTDGQEIRVLMVDTGK